MFLKPPRVTPESGQGLRDSESEGSEQSKDMS